MTFKATSKRGKMVVRGFAREVVKRVGSRQRCSVANYLNPKRNASTTFSLSLAMVKLVELKSMKWRFRAHSITGELLNLAVSLNT